MPLEPTAIKNDLPLSYRWFRANGMKRLVPWHFSDDQGLIAGWRKEYFLEVDGTSDLIPFAFRQDMETMAGFIVVDGMALDHVTEAHLSWSGERYPWLAKGQQPSPLDPDKFPSFPDWVARTMVRDSIEWMNEEDLEAIKSRTWPSIKV
jgi:hypothetical protein